jgi:hypothetical protein
MRIKLLTHNKVGSVLLMTLMTAALIGYTLASYFSLVNSRNRSTLRSTSWNNAMALAEAGAEEALTHLNYNCLSNPVNPRSINWSADGWTSLGGNTYEKRRWIGDSWYWVTVNNNIARRAKIEAIGATAIPTTHAMNSSGAFMAASVGNITRYTVRKLSLQAVVQGMFAKGMVAKGLIDMNGNNVSVDSFDSTATNKSSYGRYDPAKRQSNGSVGTNSGLTNSVRIGQANIYGMASTGPGGSLYIGPNGGVGSIQYQSTNIGTVQTGWFSDDMNVDFPDVVNPIGAGTLTPLYNQMATVTNYVPTTNVVSGVTNVTLTPTPMTDRYDIILDTGDYNFLSGFDGKILVRGLARAYVGHNINFAGQEGVTVASGAALALYMGGQEADFGGNGTINYTGNATNFAYYGLGSNTKINLHGNTAFTGTIYAPSADLELGGGGSGGTDLVGATVSATVKLNGTFNFHYDEALGTSGPTKMFILTKWEEVAPPSETMVANYMPAR